MVREGGEGGRERERGRGEGKNNLQINFYVKNFSTKVVEREKKREERNKICRLFPIHRFK